MMRLDRWAPDPRLSGVVDRYEHRTAQLGGPPVRIALPARTEVILEFYFETPHMVEVNASGARDRAPWSVAVGPQTFRRVDLLLGGRIDVFTVHFHPTGLHAIFGLPMPELTDSALEAEHLLGRDPARILHERLALAVGASDRVRLMDHHLLAHLPQRSTDLAAEAVARLRRSAGQASLVALTQDSGLSERQFRRLFKARVGVAPKLYARIVRLNAAISAKTARPAASWTEIAHQFGWFDQAHLDKDFLALAGASPSRFVHHGPSS